MKFKKLVESFGSENTMTIRVASGLNADGCDIVVTAADGSVLHKEEYRYGYNASHNRKWAEWYPEKPYMKDIIDGLCAKYDIAKSDIIFKCGANVFTGNDVTDASVREFKNNYVESLTETYWIDSKDVMAEVDRLGKELEADGFKYYGDRYSGSTYYNFFTKRGDNGAICRAVQYNYDGAQIIDIDVDQLMGYKPIDSFEKMRRDLGRVLLPQHEDMNDGKDEDQFVLYFPYLDPKIINKERALKQMEFELDNIKNDSGASLAGRGFGIYCLQSVDADTGTTYTGRYSSKEFLNVLHEDVLTEDTANDTTAFPYMFHYSCNNPTFGYDFQLFASSLGAKKVYARYKGTGDGRYFYLVPSEEVYNKLKEVAKDKYTVEMQKLLPYDETKYPKVQFMKESFEMAAGGDDFDGEIAAMRAEQKELETRRAARKERFALMHRLFDTHMDAEPDANWVDKVYHIFDTAESTTFVGGKYGTIPGRTEDKQPIRYRYSIKEYDFYTDPYWEIVYIATNNIDPLKEDLEDEFDLLMKASEFKCKLSRYDIEEASSEDELIIYMEDVYNILADEYGAENIKWWKFYEDDDVDFGYKVCLKDGSKHIVEINNDRVDEINEGVVQESADAKPQYVICGVTNDGCRMLYDAVNDNFTTDYDSATKYDDMEVARDDWFKIPRSGFRRIFIPVYDPAIFECVTEAFDADKVQKRIACTTEFDNGHVFHNDYFRASSAEAEERARQKSIENPDRVFYVKYDDVMNPSSDIKWKNGEQLNEADEPIYFDPDDEFEVDFRYYVYGNENDVVSDSFDFEEDAIQWAKENNYPIVKIHNYYRDTDGQLNPDGDPEVIWHA